MPRTGAAREPRGTPDRAVTGALGRARRAPAGRPLASSAQLERGDDPGVVRRPPWDGLLERRVTDHVRLERLDPGAARGPLEDQVDALPQLRRLVAQGAVLAAGEAGVAGVDDRPGVPEGNGEQAVGVGRGAVRRRVEVANGDDRLPRPGRADEE